MDKLNKLIQPIVTTMNYELYHIEFVKESGENYLRVYIDSDKGIGFQDCEKVSRKISEMLDVEDPISEGYYLEVSSPGIFRTLYTEEHMNKHKNDNVLIKLNSLFEGKRKIKGVLLDFDSENVYLSVEEEKIIVPREKIKVINLHGEL